MPKYRSKPTECEAMKWAGGDAQAHAAVAWVAEGGGEARYDEEWIGLLSQEDIRPARIAVRTINGTAYAGPGYYVIRGQARFCQHIEYGQPEHECSGLVDFYPCDPETFERRWEQAD